MSFNFMAAVTIYRDRGAPPKIKSLIVSIVSPSICHEVVGLDVVILVFLMLSSKLAFSLSSFVSEVYNFIFYRGSCMDVRVGL